MSPLSGKVAFVAGANGISGFAIIEHLVRQPKTEWYVLTAIDYIGEVLVNLANPI